MLNVLSIDWDYFIDANALQRLEHFPDVPNENYAQSVKDAIWTSRYADDGELLKIGINPVAYDVAYALESMDVPFTVVCDSHKWAYTFIMEQLKETGNKQVNLLNLDYHHDCRSDIKELDCGNWLSVLMSKCRGKWRWLGWKDSYRPGKPRKLQFMTEFNKDLIKNTPWDMVFICRSDMWSPPHLDELFTDVFQDVTTDKYCKVQKGIWDSRYSEELKKDADELKKAIADWVGKVRRGEIVK